jgi:hypothetical protein
MTNEVAAAGGFLALGVLLGLAAVAGLITVMAARSRRADRRDSSLASLATLFDAPESDDPFAGAASANGDPDQSGPHPATATAPPPLAPAAASAAFGATESAPDERDQERQVDVREAPSRELAGSIPVPDSAMRFETISDRDWIDHPANTSADRDVEEGALRRVLLVPPRLVAGVGAAVAARLSWLRRPSSGEPQPADWDYESLERDFGLHERIGPALVTGLVLLAAVIVFGVWLVAAHHGGHPVVPAPHVPNPGPLGPQGSPGP